MKKGSEEKKLNSEEKNQSSRLVRKNPHKEMSIIQRRLKKATDEFSRSGSMSI